ncbi:anthranilate synthase component I [bacterium]|nr:anthranilate synthase component I [bacterium]
MHIQPDHYSFSQTYDAGKPQVIWAELHADTETPVSAALKLLPKDGYGFLLESVHGGETRGRYSLLGMDPDLLWRCNGKLAEHAVLEANKAPDWVKSDRTALEDLRHFLNESRLETTPGLPPLPTAMVGYLGYEMTGLAEKMPEPKDGEDIPDALLMRPQSMLVFDAVKGTMVLGRVVRPSKNVLAEQAYVDAKQRLEAMAELLSTPLPATRPRAVKPTPKASDSFTSNISRAGFYHMVERAKEYIRAGDIFQVVLSQRFTAPFKQSPFAFYRALRHLNPSPFLFLLNMGGFQLVGSSPEILVRLRDGKVTVRPIAGTRPRGKTTEEDNRLAEELLADEKECAEHRMLLDLGRNDAGKVSKGGTVQVTQRMIIERYSHVMHVVSNVEGDIRPECDALDALLAGFPAGTVSGAPKIRAMEIIHELEPQKRGFYAGGVGYFAADGSMDSCITLRTALIKDGKIHVQAGGGIVADSTPDGEYQESYNKAKALMVAAESAAEFS